MNHRPVFLELAFHFTMIRTILTSSLEMIQKKDRRVSVMNFEEIASEIHRIITGRKENKHAVKQLDEILQNKDQSL